MHTFDTNDIDGKKVAGYARVSTFEQADKGTSIDEQKRLILEECIHRGWQVTKIYCDEGASGKTIDRQGLQNLQRDAQMGLFETIMFTKSDRLTRSIRDLSNLWHDWSEWGLEIICIEQPEISSKGIYGKMLRNLLGIFAEWERDSIIERTTSGRMARWRKGEAFMGSLPYGYEFDKANRKIVIHPEKARICKRIFNMYLNQQHGTREIALRLSKASVPSPRGKNNWQFSAVLQILKNPAYTGRAELNMYKFETMMSKNNQPYKRRSKEKKDRRQWITVEYPPIISRSIHLKVLERMKSSPPWLFKRSNKCYGKYFLLENISLICGECGRKMSIRVLEKNAKRSLYTYYRCRRNAMSRREIATMYQNPRRCDMRIDAQTLDNFISEQVMELLNGIVSIVHCGLTHLTFQKLMERAQKRPATRVMNKLSPYADKTECYRIGAWEVKKCSKVELENMKNVYHEHAKQSAALKNNFSAATQRRYQIDEYGIDYYKISCEQAIRKNSPNLSTEVTHYINGMTFEQKKHVIESIISAEYSGKCVIRWATSSDTDGAQEDLSSLPKGRFTSGVFRYLPQIVQITFFTNLPRIQELIWDADNICKSQAY